MHKGMEDKAGEGVRATDGPVCVTRAGGTAVIALDSSLVARVREALGGPAAPPLPAAVHLEADDPLAALVALLDPEAGAPGGALADVGVRRGLLEALAKGLQLRTNRPVEPAPPRRLLRAEAWIAGTGRPVELGAVAQALGVGPRTLQRDFLRWRGCTPSAARVAARLDQARARLLAPTEALTVTEVAFDVGFGTPSRFSAAYRARFGEGPTATIRAARGRGDALREPD